jgi:DNA-binding XRE family transcriptional regulator
VGVISKSVYKRVVMSGAGEAQREEVEAIRAQLGQDASVVEQVARLEAMAWRREVLWGAMSGWREAQGLSQQEVARRMGTSQPAVARLEAGLSDPRLSTLERYASAIGYELKL